MGTNRILTEYKQQAFYRMDESLRMIRKSLTLLSEEDIWKVPNENCNSIGNQLLHLCGNIRQYAISGLGGSTDTRDRNAEFTARESHTLAGLLEKFETTLEEAKQVISSMSSESAMRMRNVQGFEFTGIGIVLHVVEHLSYHTGQIALLTKWLKDADLGFYDGMDLNIKNS